MGRGQESSADALLYGAGRPPSANRPSTNRKPYLLSDCTWLPSVSFKAGGPSGFHLVNGSPGESRAARELIQPPLLLSGFDWPEEEMIEVERAEHDRGSLNEGTAFEVAMEILFASGQLQRPRSPYACLAKLAPDGSLRSLGNSSIRLRAGGRKKLGAEIIICHPGNRALVEALGLESLPCRELSALKE